MGCGGSTATVASTSTVTPKDSRPELSINPEAGTSYSEQLSPIMEGPETDRTSHPGSAPSKNEDNPPFADEKLSLASHRTAAEVSKPPHTTATTTTPAPAGGGEQPQTSSATSDAALASTTPSSDPAGTASTPTAPGDAPGPSAADDDGLSLDDIHATLLAYEKITCELEFDTATDRIIAEACSIIDADRATLFHVDEETEELIVKVSKGATLARIPRGKGFAGQVAVSGQPMICDDVQNHPDFDPTSDNKTGYTTRTLMTVPISTAHRLVAVLQIVNKHPIGKPFTKRDQLLADRLAQMAGIVLINAKTYERAVAAERRSTALMELVRAIQSNSALGTSLLFTLTRRTQELLNAGRCDVYIADKDYETMACLSDLGTRRLLYGHGLVGAVAKTNALINLADAESDPRFDEEMKHHDAPKTVSIIVAPVTLKKSDKVVAVLALHNKQGEVSVFSREDEELLTDICKVLGDHQDHLKELQQLSANHSKDVGASASFPGDLPVSPRVPVGLRNKVRRGSLTAAMAITEEEEEEGEG